MQDAVKMVVDEDDEEEEAVEETDLSVVDAGPSNEEEGEDKKGEEEEEEWEEQVPAYVEARRLFKEAEVAAADTVELTWKVRQASHRPLPPGCASEACPVLCVVVAC